MKSHAVNMKKPMKQARFFCFLLFFSQISLFLFSQIIDLRLNIPLLSEDFISIFSSLFINIQQIILDAAVVKNSKIANLFLFMHFLSIFICFKFLIREHQQKKQIYYICFFRIYLFTFSLCYAIINL